MAISVINDLVNTCVLCESSDIQPLDTRSEIAQNRTAAFEFVFEDCLCRSCGFVFSRTRPRNHYLEQYYRDYFLSMSTIPESEAQARAALISRYIAPGSSILEIGGGHGTFQKFLIDRGYEVENYDLSTGQITQERYDAVCHYYVMEHVTDPKRWLADQVSKIRKGGHLILEVPNFFRHPTESLNNEHLNHFRPLDIESIFQSVGLRCEALFDESAGRYFGQIGVGKKENSGKNTLKNGECISGIVQRYNQLKQHEDRLQSEVMSFIYPLGGNNTIHPKVGLWPANQMTLKIIKIFRRLGICPSTIIDIDPEKQGIWWAGICPVEAPSENAVADLDVFVTLSPRHGQKIKESLAALGFNEDRIIAL